LELRPHSTDESGMVFVQKTTDLASAPSELQPEGSVEGKQHLTK
jgi:hypothetical protein